MRYSSRPVSPHRIQRLTRWVRLLLGLMVGQCAAFFAGGGVLMRRALDESVRCAGLLAVIHACDLLDVNTRRGSGQHRHGRRSFSCEMRKVIGQRVRHAMQGDTFWDRLFAILSFVRDIEEHARVLARRLKRGLTRQRIIDPLACAEPCVSQTDALILAPDSS